MDFKANVTMYAIVDRYNEGFYWNFEKNDLSSDIDGQCLLPTKEMAEQFIKDELCDDYAVIEVQIESISQRGTWCYSTNEHEIFE